MQYQVTFNYSTKDQDYTVEAVVTTGAKSVRSEFDRFQEPEDGDEVEIVSVVDENENQVLWMLDFSHKQIKDIEALAIERAG